MKRRRTALLLALAALASGAAFVHRAPPEARPVAARPPRVVRTRPALARAPIAVAPTDPAAPATPRSAFDFTGPEHEGVSEPTLSGEVPPQERAAIDAAWRSGRFGEAAARAAALARHDDRRQILRPLIAEWAAHAPEPAATFTWALPPGIERRELLETAVREWAARDLVAASGWLNTLPAGDDVDPALAVIATSDVLARFQPETALSWAEAIGGPTLRWEAICTVLLSWARRDESAALEYANRCAALDPDARRRLAVQVRQLVAPAD